MNGTLLQVPEPAMNTELQLCISFMSSTSSVNRDRLVVLTHRTDDLTELSAYFSHDKCLKAPSAGGYYFGVFTQNNDSTLEPPATPPEISIRFLSTSKNSFLDCIIHNLYTTTLIA